MRKRIFFFSESSLIILLCFLSLNLIGQTVIVGDQFSEDFIRRMQVIGKVKPSSSLMIRPNHFLDSIVFEDSIIKNDFDVLYNWRTNTTKKVFFNNKISFGLLPISVIQQYNTKNPYGWNDGAMIPARGYQTLVSPGFFARAGIFSIQFKPEIIWAQNKSFEMFPSTHLDNVWANYYYFLNRIDNPEKFGSNSYSRVLTGQSSIRLNFKSVSIGFSTENLWWGPGKRNSLLMSNNAPGFKHLTLNTTRPIKSRIGNFEFQIIAGKLSSSGILPPEINRQYNGQALYTAKPDDWRYINAAVLTWQPRWIKGLFLGISRAYYLYRNDMGKSFVDYIPVVGSIFKSNAIGEDIKKRDQLAAFFFRWVLPNDKAEFYFEYGRNDFSLNLRDILMSPEHSQAYILGFKKLVELADKSYLQFATEFTHTAMPYSINLREQEGWYRHYQVRDGYTNNGQVIGAGIGPGSNSQMISLNYYKGLSGLGIRFERLVHDNDFFYQTFIDSRNARKFWTDYETNITGNIKYKNLILQGDISLIKSFNYQWGNLQNNVIDNFNEFNRINFQFKLAVKYLL